MATRRRILFIAEAVTLAHVVRPLVLAGSLDPQEFEVHFACADRYPFVFRNIRFKRWSLKSIPSSQFINALARGTPIYDYATLDRYVKDDTELLRQIRPDVVVGDFRLSLAISARICGVPYATITNAHWSPYTTRERFPFPEHPMGRILGIRLSSNIFSFVQPFVFRLHVRSFNKLCRKHGLEEFAGLQHAYTDADHVLYADLPVLAPTADLPTNHRYLGPILWSPETDLPDWWNALDDRRPIVYVSLGSSGQVDVLPEVIGALAKLPVTAILATAGRLETTGLPENFYAADFLPGEMAAQRASLVICSGGSAPVYQALNEGTPILGVPSNMDQHLTMDAVQRCGAGMGIRSDSLARSEVGQTTWQLVTESSWRENAARLAEEMSNFNAAEAFASSMNDSL